VDGDASVASVDADDDGFAEARGSGLEDGGLFNGDAAEDDALYAARKIALDGVEATDAAADLAGNRYGVDDDDDDAGVHGASLTGTVEVDEVETRRAFNLPAAGDGYGVVGEDGLASVVALVEANATAVADIDGGY
jgi:hypothetical protein